MGRPGTRAAFAAVVVAGALGGVAAKLLSDSGDEPLREATSTFTVPEELPAPSTYPARPATTATTETAAAPKPKPARPAPARLRRPPIVQDPIPFPQSRKDEMAAYARRHYGLDTYALEAPKVIVEHVAVAASAASVKATFSPDRADPELGELPNVCSHFVVDRDGSIHQLVPLDVMCRHTVGLNYTAIGIEHAGFSDGDVMGNAAELRASLALTHWLRCRYGIALRDVIGHNESLDSPYHRENVPALRRQTHGDMRHATMEAYRARLRGRPCR